ncbi:MAG: hypothetical protein ACREV3_12650 [Gammaproteobacteria bacterium]
MGLIAVLAEPERRARRASVSLRGGGQDCSAELASTDQHYSVLEKSPNGVPVHADKGAERMATTPATVTAPGETVHSSVATTLAKNPTFL